MLQVKHPLLFASAKIAQLPKTLRHGFL